MPKIAKYVAIAIGALIAILLIIIAIVAATFNPNDYKPLIIKLVQQKKERTLSIPGDIKLTFFPKIGADLGKISLSEHKSNAEFASIDSARVSLALWPLLSKHLVVDRIAVDGLNARLIRYKDGTTNIDDLVSKDQSASGGGDKGSSSGGPISFNIDSIHVGNAKIVYDDQQQNRMVEISSLNIDSGEIANNVPSKLSVSADIKNNQPKLAIKMDAKTGFTFDLDQQHYVLKGLDATVNGAALDYSDVMLKAAGDADLKPASKQFALNGIALSASAKHAAQMLDAKFTVPQLAITQDKVSGGKMNGEATLTEGARNVHAQFSAPSFDGTPQAFKIPDLAVDAIIKDATLNAGARLAGTITGDIDKLLFSSQQLVLTLDGKQGTTAINGSLTTPLSVNMKTKLIDLPKIAAAFNLPNPNGGSIKLKADGQANANLDKKTAAANFKGALDEGAFDAKFGVANFSPLALTFDIGIDKLDADRYMSKTSAQATATQQQKSEPEKPLDLSALKTLNAKGSIRIGALKVENIRATNVKVDLHAAEGKVDVSPLAANLYDGTVAGAITLNAAGTPHLAMRQKLSGINLGPLLKDAIGKEPIDGKGNVQMDVTTQGALVSQMKKALAGTAQLELRDGAVHGINIAQMIRNAKAKLGAISGGSQQSGTSSASDKTDFSELKGSFRIANGVAHNDDLSAKSPLIRASGSGDIDIANERLDYLVKATIVGTLQGQGGPELQALKGVTVPVKLSGPFTAIGWKIDFGGMVNDLAKQKIDTEKEKLKEEAKNKVQQQLKEGLKGLLGK
jgi:AsmA protein